MAEDAIAKRPREDAEDAEAVEAKKIKVEEQLAGPTSSTEAVITNPEALEPKEPEATSAGVEATSTAEPLVKSTEKPAVAGDDIKVEVKDEAPDATTLAADSEAAKAVAAEGDGNQAGTKRGRDDDNKDAEVADPETGKKAKIDQGESNGVEGEAASPEENKQPAQRPGPDKPVKIAFKTFQNGGECRKYYNRLLQNLSLDQDLNEYEFEMVSQLIINGHPDANRKVGSGITRIQVKRETYEGATTNVFLMMRKDGTTDDVSVRKCIFKLFPAYALEAGEKEGGKQRTGGGRGKGRGRGRGRGRARRGS